MSEASFSNFWRNLFSGLRAEARYVLTHPKAWIVGLALPIFWCLLLIGTFSSSLMRELPLALVNADRSVESTALVLQLDALPSVKVESFDSPAQALKAVRSGRYYGYIHIPENFTRESYSARGAALELYLNKSVYAIGVTLEIDIKQALLAYQKDVMAKLALTTGVGEANAQRWLNTVAVNTVNLGNIPMNFQAYLLPTLIPGILHLAMILMTVTSLIRYFWDNEPEREFGLSPGTIAATALGKVAFWWMSYSTMGLSYLAWFAGYGAWALPESQIGLWALALIILMLAMGCIALLLTGLFIRMSPIIALSFATAYTAPIYPFTGFSFPLESMDKGAQFFSQWLPLTHFLRLQSEAWILGSPAGTWIVSLGILLGFAGVALSIGLPLFVYQTRQIMKAKGL